MSQTAVILAVVFEALLAVLSFMLAAFAGGGYANGAELSAGALRLLTACLYLLPAFCVFSAGMLIAGLTLHWSRLTYAWSLAPVALDLLYCLFVCVRGLGATGRPRP